MSIQTLNPPEVSRPIGPYSQAVQVRGDGRWLHIAGQIGADAEGVLACGFEGQAEQAWKNIMALLRTAGMDAGHLVKVVTYLTREEDIPLLGPIRLAYLGEARPAATLVVAKALARKEWLIEIEAVAFRAH